MIPLFTWQVSRKSGGRFYGCSLEFDRLHNEMDAVRAWSAAQSPPGRVAAMVFWTPGDGGNATTGPAKDCGQSPPASELILCYGTSPVTTQVMTDCMCGGACRPQLPADDLRGLAAQGPHRAVGLPAQQHGHQAARTGVI